MPFDRKRFPGLTNEEYQNFVRGSNYYTNFIVWAVPRLNDEENVERDQWIARINEGPTGVEIFDLLCPAYFKAFKRITGYDTKSLYDGTFPFDSFPLDEN